MSSTTYIAEESIVTYPLWMRQLRKRSLMTLTIELTARCNCDCRHCYINLPTGDQEAITREMSYEMIDSISSQAVDMGTLWMLLSGGEPLLRPDFEKIWIMLKRKGFLLSLFTNAILIKDHHIDMFKAYQPRDLEVSVYGITEKTYEKVTRKPGSYRAFRKGLDKLLDTDLDLTLKTVVMRTNYHEIDEIMAFCERHSRERVRHDPVLHLRYDMNEERNREIREERLTPEQLIHFDQRDPEREKNWKRACSEMIRENIEITGDSVPIFTCGAATTSAVISYDGTLRPCISLVHPDYTRDLNRMSLADAWSTLADKPRRARSSNPEFKSHCASCSLRNLCNWCPAVAHIETGSLDKPIELYCDYTHERVNSLKNKLK